MQRNSGLYVIIKRIEVVLLPYMTCQLSSAQYQSDVRSQLAIR